MRNERISNGENCHLIHRFVDLYVIRKFLIVFRVGSHRDNDLPVRLPEGIDTVPVNEAERDALYNTGWGYEGVSWVSAPSAGSEVDLVNRFYNPNTGTHFFTSDTNEKNVLRSVGWQDEGVAFISDSEKRIPVYRLYHDGFHIYTPSNIEKDTLLQSGWSDEGTSFYGVSFK